MGVSRLHSIHRILPALDVHSVQLSLPCAALSPGPSSVKTSFCTAFLVRVPQSVVNREPYEEAERFSRRVLVARCLPRARTQGSVRVWRKMFGQTTRQRFQRHLGGGCIEPPRGHRAQCRPPQGIGHKSKSAVAGQPVSLQRDASHGCIIQGIQGSRQDTAQVISSELEFANGSHSRKRRGPDDADGAAVQL